ncbi:MAG: Abortive infection protein [Phenylobacterium sp.]|nr:Abortive infection protein [Phenylobacterium sp.]
MKDTPLDAPTGERTPAGAALDLVVILAATALLLSLFPASHAASFGLVRRLLVPGRLLLLVLLATVLLRRRGGRWRDLGLRRPGRPWLAPVLVIGGFVGGELAAGVTAQLLFPLLHLTAPAVPPFLQRAQGHLGEYLYWMIPVTWGSAAFGEEMLFRGFVLDRLDELLGRRAIGAAVLLQGLLFGAAHAYLGASGAIIAGVLGLVLGSAFVLGGRNLWPCIVIHGLVDSTSITAVFLGLVHGR